MGKLPEDKDLAKKIALTAQNYEMIEGRLYFLEQPRNSKMAKINPLIERLCVPQALQMKIMQGFHDQNGHPGVDRCIASIKRRYKWGRMYSDVREYTKACTACATSKKTTRPQFAPLKPIQNFSKFQRWSVDLIRKNDGF